MPRDLMYIPDRKRDHSNFSADLPGIVSEETVGFLDPHERHFAVGESGQRYDIKDDLLHPSSKNQFMPFHGIFGCDLESQKTYDGTLFRFPLRVAPSNLSKKKYTKQMIDSLFESLREESSVILLFLKSVQSISVYERMEGDEMNCVFKVEVGVDTLPEIRRKRQEFLREPKEFTVRESSYVMNVLEARGSQTRSFRWLIVNKIDSSEERIAELAGELCVLPWIGLAVPINTQARKESAGRIFCFLPLPPDVDCQTGLPVYVHGYFGLTDNRRGLVWPGAECQNTKTAEWNELLLKNIAVKVYCKIIDTLVKNEPHSDISQELRRQLVYSSLPVLGNVRGHWKILSELLISALVHQNQKLFYARQLFGNSWIALNEGVLDRVQEPCETREAIFEILLNNHHMIITNLPPHVLEIVSKYFPPPRDITPVLLRSVLKTQDISSTSRKEKLLLLDYVLRDNPTSDLIGVPLLPLANGQFSEFTPHNPTVTRSKSVFVPSVTCTARLLPNMKHRFLDENLPEAVTKKLSAMAAHDSRQENPTQLVHLMKEMVLQNLRSSLPLEWFNGREIVQWIVGHSSHPPKSWLKEIWQWIHSSFPTSLLRFEGIPLIELPQSGKKCLGVLSRHSRFIFAFDGSGNTLPSQISSLLTACGCTVLSDVPFYLRHLDINSYIAPPTPAGTMIVLGRVPLETLQEHIKQTSTSNDRNVLREFFCRLPKRLSFAQENLLLQLPLFETLHGTRTSVKMHGQTLKAASSNFSLPRGFTLIRSDQIISSADPKASQLLNLLAVEILKPAEIFIQYLFPDLRNNFIYDVQDISLIMRWILQQTFIFKTQCKRFLPEMKALPFLSTERKQMKKPAELYDPSDALLLDLFAGQTNKFPTKDYTDAYVISTLKELGLRTRCMLMAAELLEVAMSIASSLVSQSSIAKVRALVKILQDHPDYLNQRVGGGATLKDKLIHQKWLPRARVPPENVCFPEIMPWFKGNSSFFAPTELRSKAQAILVGSSMPILDAEMNQDLQGMFGLNSDPPVHQVVSQLKTAVERWEEKHHGRFTSKFEEMLVTIYLHLSHKPNKNVRIALNNASLTKWIWQGAGFCSPEQMALEKDFPLDLRPQLFILPEDLKVNSSLTKFFLQHGVQENFSERDILVALVGIRDKHASFLPEMNLSKEVQSDLKLCRAILEWFVKDGKTLHGNLQERVLVPVQSASNVLVLQPCKKCTYCDREWLRRGRSELDIPEDYMLIHDSIPPNVASLLGVPALSTCLLAAETLGFEQTGPYEPLTTRLKNILKEYKEGVSVFKELIQNADDAGASKIRFLVDWRHGPTEKLLSPKMVECQGPALWAYNNAVFTDKDFENINKLAGATKVEDLAKIGRFGLGFNSVYHLTDVPSFVSREYFVMFDPNVNHLGGYVYNKSRPGIRIDLAANSRPLSAFEDQFQPYHDVFGCKIQRKQREKFYFDGTLFRFPFRTLQQKKESEICHSVYDKEKVSELVCSLKESASLLLLYTQNVNQVELYAVNQGDNPKKMELELSVTKNTRKILRSENRLSTTFIEECSNWWQKRLTSSDSEVVIPSRCELVTSDIRERLTGLTSKSEKRELWLLTSTVGTDSSVHLATNEGREHGLLPCASAAIKLSDISGNGPDVAPPFCLESVQGEAFCFLPLSIPTGLPVHLNGYFAITSNRRRIWERNSSNRFQPIEVQWNECLMKDALSNAYIQLLKDMKNLSEDGKLEQYDFHMLWPCYDTLNSSTWETLVKSLYTKLVEEDLSLFHSDGKWLSIHEGYVLDQQLLEIPEVAQVLKFFRFSVFHLPPKLCTSLEKSGQGHILVQRTLTLKKFLQRIFFPKITKISQSLRDAIVCYGLDCIYSGQDELIPFFKNNLCIPCSANEDRLAKPCDLVNPNGAAAHLFFEEDHRFPAGEHFLTKKRAYVLEQMGMVKDKLSWQEILERADSVEKLTESGKGRELARKIIKYLKENIEKLAKANENDESILRRTRFLPVMSEPPGKYFLPWKGSEQKEQFLAPMDLFLPDCIELIGSSSLIVDDSNDTGSGKLTRRVQNLLGFNGRQPKVEQVIQQLNTVITAWSKLRDKQTKEQENMVQSICKRVYKYFENLVSQRNKGQQQQSQKKNKDLGLERLLTKLGREDWLFIRGRFVSSTKVAHNWFGNGDPFLYGVPLEFRTNYYNLLNAAGVKQSFDKLDFIDALYALQDSKKGHPLDEEELKLAVSFLNELNDVENETIKKHVNKIPLPDTGKVLYPSDSLTINQTFWLKNVEGARYVHRVIPQELALDLGAKPLETRILKKYSNTIGTSFGQQEKLTDRLSNILESYRCDSGILKELVQNADDAHASEIHFIYDTRELPSECVFQKNAKEIQGPALCVYNDRPFSDKDLEGIQKLGIGSKGDDPEKTGRYGIGFNAVYHLTDCPSFLSNDDTLCYLDPLCRYAPEATPESPGELFRPIDREFKESFPDVLRGYLGEHFDLKGSTMFRFPQRTSGRFSEVGASIAKPISSQKMEELLDIFQDEAKKMLMFLNHIKKIALWKIGKQNKLQRTYEVESGLDPEHVKKREEISSMMKTYKSTPTGEIPWEGRIYPMSISDSKGVVETWLVHQCLGALAQSQTERQVIPDGRRYSLFPRGGIAALVSSTKPSTDRVQSQNVAYCLLPLPVPTSLPVLVNGHFALCSSRRAIWLDTEPNRELTKWNDMMKSRVLAPGYAALIREARHYIPHCEVSLNKAQYYFPDCETAKIGLDWYYNLFPKVSTDTEWKLLSVEVYRLLGTSRARVLPVVVHDEPKRDTYRQKSPHRSKRCSSSEIERSKTQKAEEKAQKLPLKIRSWVSVDEGFFMSEELEKPEETSELLLRIGLPLLLYSPLKVYNGFQEARGCGSLLSPKGVLEFLRTFRSKKTVCEIGQLPSKLEDTKIGSIEELDKLINYCKEEETFNSLLEGLPLLLTADCHLRVFDHNNVVYLSKYSDLFPDQAHLFVHPRFAYKYKLPKIIENVEQKDSIPRVMCPFTLEALAQFIPDVFPPSFRGVVKHEPWTFRDNGVLSEEWFKRLWNYLQSYFDSEQTEGQVSLEILKEWPIIPTTCGKLVTINNAKTVFDMTETGTEIEREKKIREVLKKLKCPTLNKDITSEGTTGSTYQQELSNDQDLTDAQSPEKTTTASTKLLFRQAAVTDPYVAHPHSVADVLQVLDYMRGNGILQVLDLTDDEFQEILEFFQDEHEYLERNDHYRKILKDLPLHKSIHGSRVRLSAKYAFVPKNVPLDGIETLQSRTERLFLHGDALPALLPLYKGLGTTRRPNVSQFYIDFILPNFSMFDRKSQEKHLVYLKDEELPISPKKDLLLESLRRTPCVPDEKGNLNCADKYFDPGNELFRIMLASNLFPPSPFNEDGWLDFLVSIGLQEDVSEKQFLEFSEKVARIGNQSSDYNLNVKRSKTLVDALVKTKSLLKIECLQSSIFLSKISTVKFIASDKVSPEFSSMHEQYQCTGEEHPPFISYLDAVPSIYQNLVWTSAPLLPTWAHPNEDLVNNGLKIVEEPTVETVVKHLKNISGSLTQTTKKEILSNPDKVQEIMTSIYSFLSENIKCPEKEVSDCCTETCKEVGRRLRNVRCIYMEDKTLIKGEQLSFKLRGKNRLNPFLYTTPREYGGYEHLLKRLGATEKVISLQLANVLKAMKERSKNGPMDHDFESKAKIATVLLLECVDRESRHGENVSKISDLTEMFLPSDTKFLVKSNELVSKVPLRLLPIISEQNYHVLFPLEECGLPRASVDRYLTALPEHLRPVPWNQLVSEVLDPLCLNATCQDCQDDSVCRFIERYIDILKSTHFQEGVARLLIHQKQSNELTEEDEERSSRFLYLAKVEIKCMQAIKVCLVDAKTQKPLERSYSRERPCYVDKKDNRWKLYVMHDTTPLGFLTKLVNEVMDSCIEDRYLPLLTDMLQCDSPSKISEWLTEEDITLFSSKENIMAELSSDESEDELDETEDEPRLSRLSQTTESSNSISESHWCTTPDRNEAHRWMTQSLSDLDVAKFLLTANPPFSATACFFSHQVVEKGLKAILYAKCGINDEQLSSHKVYELASDVETRMKVPSKFIDLAAKVRNYYLPTRYPNKQPSPVVPAEAYDEEQARNAVQNAADFLEIVEILIDW